MDQGPALVSVVMPCFNTDVQHVDEALESVFAQTYDPIEVVVVNDGSTDPRLLARLRQLGESGRIVLIHQENEGPASARNTAVRASRGKYVLPVDADDRIAPDYVEKGVTYLETHPATPVLYGEGQYFGARSGPIGAPPYSERAMLADNMIFNSAMYRREAFDRVGGYNPRMTHGLEDHEFWLRVCAELGPPHRLPDTVLYYRIGPDSRNARVNADRDSRVDAMAEIFRANHELYARHPDLLFRIIEDTRAEVDYWAGRYWKLDRLLRRLPLLERAAGRLRRGPLGRWM